MKVSIIAISVLTVLLTAEVFANDSCITTRNGDGSTITTCVDIPSTTCSYTTGGVQICTST